MRLTSHPMPWDSFPLADKPFVVIRDLWVKDADGGAENEGVFLGRFDTWSEAEKLALADPGSVGVFLYRRNPNNGAEGGDSIARFSWGQLRWKDDRACDRLEEKSAA